MQKYRVGLPGWKLAAKWGVPVRLRVNITQDLDGLIVEAHTLDELKDEALAAASVLLELALHTKPQARTDFIWHSTVPA